jgi:NTE family protein
MPSQPTTPPRKRIVVVLGAGGIQCAAGLGLAKVLAREGLAIDLLVGCNGGSLFAAVMALGMPCHQAAATLGKLWCHELTRQRDERAILRAMLRAASTGDNTLLPLLTEAFGAARIEDTAIALQIKATDTRSGAQAVFTQGSLAEVVRTSNLRPFTYEPWMLKDCMHADQFWPAPPPARAHAGADIVLTLGFANPAEETGEALPAFAALHLGGQPPQQHHHTHAMAAHPGDVIAVVPEFAEPIGRFDNRKIAHIIAQGERATEAILPRLYERLRDTRSANGQRPFTATTGASERKKEVDATHG